MKGKRGWLRILEATIAVLIISATMLAVYSQQSIREDLTVETYAASLQKEILDDIVSDIDFRQDALRVVDDVPSDSNYAKLDLFVSRNVPDGFGYLLKVCDLGSICKMDNKTFIATMDKDVYVEESIISSELGDGSNRVYSPKKVRLFLWEGSLPASYCRDECVGPSLGCSLDLKEVVSMSCGNYDEDSCLEYGNFMNTTDCEVLGQLCDNATCKAISHSMMHCAKRDVFIPEDDCVYGFEKSDCTDLGYDDGERVGSCDAGFLERFYCWNNVYKDSLCSVNPVCPSGYDWVSTSVCGPENPDEGSLSVSFSDLWHSLPGGNHRYLYTVTFQENNGVNLNINKLKKCKSSGECVEELFSPPLVVNSGESNSLTDQYLDTPLNDETFDLTYFVIDHGGVEFSVTEKVRVVYNGVGDYSWNGIPIGPFI
jgi:hypothetical protein